jgi:hypothetical protein
MTLARVNSFYGSEIELKKPFQITEKAFFFSFLESLVKDQP